MERKYLEQCLAKGMSLKAIGDEVGRHPATVSYWLKKHGLQPVGSKFAPKGQLDRARLEELIDQGKSLRKIAAMLGIGLMQVRYWVRKYELEPARVARLRAIRDAVEAGRADIELTCGKHGRTTFKIIEGGRARCRRCNSERVSRRRRRVKEILVQEAGGRCAICGYDKHPRALEFHHLDPAEKSFGIGGGLTRSLEETRREAAKCILLCSNCHMEVEEGLVAVPLPLNSGAATSIQPSPSLRFPAQRAQAQ